jgi:hypothetical protein
MDGKCFHYLSLLIPELEDIEKASLSERYADSNKTVPYVKLWCLLKEKNEQ